MQPSDRNPSRVLLWLLELGVVLAAIRRLRTKPTGPPGLDPASVAVGYERSDMRPGMVILSAAALLLVLAAVLVGITAFQVWMTGIPLTVGRPVDLIQGLKAAPAPTPPAPALQAESGQDFVAYKAAAVAKLSSYRWVDRQAGVVSIPIERAMDLVAQRGLPARSTPPAYRDQGTGSPSPASSGRVDEAYP